MMRLPPCRMVPTDGPPSHDQLSCVQNRTPQTELNCVETSKVIVKWTVDGKREAMTRMLSVTLLNHQGAAQETLSKAPADHQR